MTLRDLQRFTYRHCLDLAFDSQLPNPIEAAIAVGWLGKAVPNTGSVEDHLHEALRWASVHQKVDGGELGYHACDVCGYDSGTSRWLHEERGEFCVRWEDRIYIMPQMMLHYISAHRYLPAEYFLQDLHAWWTSAELPGN